ncbi:dienelactone hydrolase family protein [Rhizobium sp. RHZ01]|uniref:dienelactone hydrolase family protein n=1 Tax=Rhizobium sp. RHZ01 TaxID=2769304 RepID=UPI001783705A|nr:dienelactone hydrolase family protein [Rhizobium sp. RHZ01]MBD9448107.1 dienelactone hydrolase family protein [Rhizobium sp. RHZ01]
MIDRDNLASIARRHRDTSVFPLRFGGSSVDFATWRSSTLAYVVQSTDPDACHVDRVETIAQWDCSSYAGRRLSLRFSNGEVAEAILLLPHQQTPAPALLMLHDHGATFDIGKEKVVPAPSDSPTREAAQAWADRFYGGRFPGEAAARRGYVVLSVDALGWSSRCGNGYEAQQALAANLMQFGVSLASVVAMEDIAAAKFLGELPEVDRKRVASFGFSFGGYRAWQVAALSADIAAFCAIGWMGTLEGLMQTGGNQLRGQSAFYMLHPQIAGKLDYPDFAGLAAPKPGYFLSGREDRHFPPAVVEAAFGRLRELWSAGRGMHNLKTAIWQGGHEFPIPEQDAALNWLDAALRG